MKEKSHDKIPVKVTVGVAPVLAMPTAGGFWSRWSRAPSADQRTVSAGHEAGGRASELGSGWHSRRSRKGYLINETGAGARTSVVGAHGEDRSHGFGM